MDWNVFNAHNEAPDDAFETMCVLLFKNWVNREYGQSGVEVHTVNGKGGDGGVEAYAVLSTGGIVGVQAKWFRSKIGTTQIKQIENSFLTAIKIRPSLKKYIICIPKDMTSKRMVHGKQVSKSSEDDKWTALACKLNNQYPECSIDLWDETTITAELMYPASDSIRNYYFEDQEITREFLLDTYNRNVHGWKKSSYVPDTYNPGHIHSTIVSFLGTKDLALEKYNTVSRIDSELQALSSALNDLLLLTQKLECNESIVSDIMSDIAYTDDLRKIVSDVLLRIKDCNEIYDNPFGVRLDFHCAKSKLKDSILAFRYHNHFHAVTDMVSAIEDDWYKCFELFDYVIDNKKVFLGDAGTGKTIGVLTEAASLWKCTHHIPIIIQAADISKDEDWNQILTKTLALSGRSSGDSIFQALDTTAHISEIQDRINSAADEITIKNYIVIFVDGLDESQHYEFWERRIVETEYYKDKFTRIKFVFSARPYVLPEYYKKPYYTSIEYIPSSGDAAVEDLFDTYIDYYNIDINGNEWIRDSLVSPISLRLFCEIYRGKKIDELQRNSVIITELFKNKLALMEKEFTERHHLPLPTNIIHHSAAALSSAFKCRSELTLEDITALFENIALENIVVILSFLAEHGMIYKVIRQTDDILKPSKEIYKWGSQPAADYLLAANLCNNLIAGKEVNGQYSTGTLEMLSVLLLEKEGKFVFEYPSFKVSLDNPVLFDLECFALTRVTPMVAVKFSDRVLKLMSFSPLELHLVVNQLILPVSRMNNHPLGPMLLDKYLRGFPNAATRDIWWSIPSYLRDAYDKSWYSNEAVNLDTYQLKDKDPYNGLPLVYAWRLTSVENEIRNECRIALSRWGLNNDVRYFELLRICSDVNDPQMVSDLFSIALGIALNSAVSDEYLQNTGQWILNNVFSPDGLKKYCDASVRYYAKSIVEIAEKHDILLSGFERVKLPYQYDIDLLPIAVEASAANRMSGYSEINYDLARYVLCDHINGGFLEKNWKTKRLPTETTEMINRYKERYGLIGLDSDGLIISTAYQFLLNNGWTEQEFVNKPTYDGVDSYIRRTYYQADHGSQSTVMSVAEKYVWCARNAILAFYADHIPYYDSEAGFQMIDDYGKLDGYEIPLESLMVKEHIDSLGAWRHTSKLATISDKSGSVDSIEKWMQYGPLPNFQEWIRDNDSNTLLYSATRIENEEDGISEAVYVSSGMVKEMELLTFIENVDKDRDICASELLNADSFHSGVDSYLYCTPIEICGIPSKKDCYDSIIVSDGTTLVTAFKAITRCVGSFTGDPGEKEFIIPSKKMREVTGITYGDGYYYKDMHGKEVAHFEESGNPWKTHQASLLVDEEVLGNALNSSGYKMFWLFRIIRRATYKYIEMHPEMRRQADHTYIVWENDNNDIVWKQLREPDHEDWNISILNDKHTEERSELMALIKAYSTAEDEHPDTCIPLEPEDSIC